ncbi:MAG: isoleucine--tRNA ligase [Actinomycetota bacterium]
MREVFHEVSANVDFPTLEREVLEFWRERDIFHRSVTQRQDAAEFVFYEGPPTANGRPGVHHVLSRTFKDLFPRFQTMRGMSVHRKGGWDCHGLPVELGVEKELGISHKSEIEDFGIADFTARCRESVRRYVEDWERLTERIGFWVDISEAYWTLDPTYVESVWWSLRRVWDRGLLYEDFKVVPYCPRCGTALSDHEVAMGYESATDPSVFVLFPIISGPLADEGASLLVWTTTPWTLISNVAVAIHPELPYALVEAEGRKMVMAEALVSKVFGDSARILRQILPQDLVRVRYQRPFDFLEADREAWYVTTADFVTTEDGSGIVHIAPAFGAEDMEAGRTWNLPVLNPVDLEGKFTAQVPPFEGLPVKEADEHIIEDLRERGILVRRAAYTHTYPFCWRCHTPLLYYALTSWYVRTTAVKDALLRENAQVDWHPEHIREGRFGDWLAHNVDWAISRARYWGTPLPIWRCPQGHAHCVGSFAELGELSGRDMSGFDPHRPAVDEIGFPCPECGEESRRIPDVLDAWWDSGSMPFAQWHYPFENSDLFDSRYPADFISEAIDQTRGWFYSLMAVGTLLFDRSPYRTVVCLGHIVDREGRKMSKSAGNVLDPWSVLDVQGADALRWFLVSSGSPWSSRRISPEAIQEGLRRFLLTLWNTHVFFVSYARIDGFDPAGAAPAVADRPLLDRWILSELHQLVADVTSALESYDATGAGRGIESFVDGLSNWYVRRSRRRFWKAESDADKQAAYHTLYECLTTLSKLLAPFTPFVADALYRNLTVGPFPESPESVHLAAWPQADPATVDLELGQAMSTVRRLVALGRQARTETKVRVRQPLARAMVSAPAGERRGVDRLADLICEELNVKAVQWAQSTGGLASYRLTPQFRALGRRFASRTKEVAEAISKMDAEAVATAFAADQPVTVDLSSEAVTLTAEEIQVIEEPRTGWHLASDGPYSVALDLEISPDLRLEGMARELVRAIQDLRKEAGLALEDRIELCVSGSPEVTTALDAWKSYVQEETLAVTLLAQPKLQGNTTTISVEGASVQVWLKTVVEA